MNNEIVLAILASALPVARPFLLEAVRNLGEDADEGLEKERIAKLMVDELLVPTLEAFLDELKEERGLIEVEEDF